MAHISLQHIKKTYDNGVTVIPDLNLEIQDREFVVLVGPSGCGKSTTLRMIAGLEDISGGELYIGDRCVNRVKPKDRDIAMVFQNYALYPHMSVYQNISFGLELRHVDKKEIDEKVHWAAGILDLEPYLNRKPKALSGGQRQRVALGRAMVRNPSVFLLDEPLSNLDAKLRTEMRSQITRLHKQLQTTFVYVTHDQIEAMTMGDRICVMKDGTIQQFDTPQVLYDCPQNMFVAGFIGSPQMNFIHVTAERSEDQWMLRSGGWSTAVPEEKLAGVDMGAYEGKEICMGIRPEDIHLSESGGAAAVSAHVDLAEMMGNEIYLYLTAFSQQIIARVPARSQAKTGSDLAVCVDAAHMHLFDLETQRRIGR